MIRLSSIITTALVSVMAVTSWPIALSAQEFVNPMHPTFPLLDQEGNLVIESGQPYSSETSCGACHDVNYIDTHSSHPPARVEADCADCHIIGENLEQSPWQLDERGWVKRESLRLGAPQSEQCGACHGMVHSGSKPVVIPDDFTEVVWREGRNSPYAITLGTGAIISGQNLQQQPNHALSAAYINGFRPLLAPTRGADGLERFAPYNAVNRRRLAKKEKVRERVYVYSVYDRVWHWTMAGCGIVLLVTGFKIHLGPAWSFFDESAQALDSRSRFWAARSWDTVRAWPAAVLRDRR